MDSFDFNNYFISGINEDNEGEFIPILSIDDDEIMNNADVPEILPILPLRNTVLFPGVVIPITVNREKSINLIKESFKSNKLVGVTSQKDVAIDDPMPSDLNSIGTMALVIKILQMPDSSTTVIIQGKKRFQINEIVQTAPYLKAKVSSYEQKIEVPQDKNFEALIASIKDLAIQIIKLSPNMPSEAAFAIKNIESPGFLINFISNNLNIDVTEKQKILEISNFNERANLVLLHLTKELQMLELKNQIQSKVKVDIDKQQRNYLLNQQLKTIQEELGINSEAQDVTELKEKAKSKKWNKEIAEVFDKELNKLLRMHPAAAEYSVQLNYLELLVELPWGEFTKDKINLDKARQILDEDHYGLEKIKDRIIEYLAVLKLKGDMKSPILCFVGPPGIGKTSLGKSIARALGRNYYRMSLGGLRDEAEIRGHRKTYIGAMPGRIIQNLRKAKSANPVFVLDEIDKVSNNTVTGDPSSALLEVLDPEQNNSFYDHYLEVEFDLSRVMFIATANTTATIQPALLDRMEIIDMSGYLLEEKIEIAKRHLIPKQLSEHGVKNNQLAFSKKVLEKLIDNYTRESGVRNLEKQIAKVIRNRATFIASENAYEKNIEEDDLQKILGAPKFIKDKKLAFNMAGVVTGLAWTTVGGEILFVEVSLSNGKGNLSLTGNLGDVMKESASLAYEYLKSKAELFNIKPELFENKNVHIHIPEGATPKDGPSAGITLFTALVSAFTQRKARSNVAMTGEITLRGKVLPVGGIKEKILAAKRANIKEIIISEENKNDIEEINQIYLSGLTFHLVQEMSDAVDIALLEAKK